MYITNWRTVAVDRPDLRRTETPDVETSPSSAATHPKAWVDELIEMTRPGMDMELPERGFIHRPPPFVFDDFS
jgi:hypothetical protein